MVRQQTDLSTAGKTDFTITESKTWDTVPTKTFTQETVVQQPIVVTKSSTTVWDNVPVRSLDVSYEDIPTQLLTMPYEASGKTPVGNTEWLRRRTGRLGVAYGERLQGWSWIPSENWRRERWQVQQKYRTYNSSRNTLKVDWQTDLQKGYDLWKSKPSTRRWSRYYFKFPLKTQQESSSVWAKNLLTKVFGQTSSQQFSWSKYDPYMLYPSITFDQMRKPGDLALTDQWRTTPVNTDNNFTTFVKEAKSQVQQVLDSDIVTDVRERLTNLFTGSERREIQQ